MRRAVTVSAGSLLITLAAPLPNLAWADGVYA
jgi:hypothetical protein